MTIVSRNALYTQESYNFVAPDATALESLQEWATVAGGLIIKYPDQAVLAGSAAGDCVAHWVESSFDGNQWAEVELGRNVGGVNAYIGPALRCSVTGAVTYIFVDVSLSDNNCYLGHFINGALDYIIVSRGPAFVGSIVRLEVTGHTYRLFIDGHRLAQRTVATFPLIGAPGVKGFSAQTGVSETRATHWRAGNMSGSISAPIPPRGVYPRTNSKRALRFKGRR